MDYSQYLRLKEEASNVYLKRTKTVDSSLLTLQRQQKAAYCGYNDKNTVVDGTCPKDHTYVQGYSVNSKISQEDSASRMAGKAIAHNIPYETASSGIQLLSCEAMSTIRNSYNNNTPAPGVWKNYGNGINKFFPEGDSNSDCYSCKTSKVTYPS